MENMKLLYLAVLLSSIVLILLFNIIYGRNQNNVPNCTTLVEISDLSKIYRIDVGYGKEIPVPKELLRPVSKFSGPDYEFRVLQTPKGEKVGIYIGNAPSGIDVFSKPKCSIPNRNGFTISGFSDSTENDSISDILIHVSAGRNKKSPPFPEYIHIKTNIVSDNLNKLMSALYYFDD